MSYITFRTATDEARLRGPERAYLGLLCAHAAAGAILGHLGERRAGYLFDNPAAWPTVWERVRYGVGVMSDAKIRHGTELLEGWLFGLNTAYVVGGDVLKLAARVYAQCEIHGWIAAKDCEWFAGIIRFGLQEKMLRPGMGWEHVIGLLFRAQSDEPDTSPVVMEYSVTDSFVSRRNAPILTKHEWEALYETEGDAGLWARCLPALQRYPQIQPSDWGTYRFGHCVSVFDIDPTTLGEAF